MLSSSRAAATSTSWCSTSGSPVWTETLLRHPDEVLTRQQLLSRVWGFDFDPGSNVVDVCVRYLRGKLGADRIEPVRGAGYRLATSL